MGLFSGAKDRVLENMALAVLNRSVLPAYGRMTALRIDSTTKTIDATLELNGEASPVRIQLFDYSIFQENNQLYLQVARIETSRPWLTAAARDFAAGQKFKLPAQAASYISQLL